jgi:asparagine synthase (glutamine-hydrolysing)
VPTYYVAKETRKHVTVALNGDGGDESFAGYKRYLAMGLSEKYRRVPSFLRESVIKQTVNRIPTSPLKGSRVKSAKRLLDAVSLPRVDRYTRWVSVFNEETKKPLYSDFFREQTRAADATGLLGEWFKRANGIGILDAMLLTDQMTYLPNDLLVKVDIAAMAVSLEARSPFLDHHVIEFAASLPQNLKLRGLTTKYVLKKALRKLLPNENLNRSKMGFGVPVGHWFRGKMQPFLREVILSEKASRRGLFKPEGVRQLIELHSHGERDYSQQLWTLLMLELWFNRFID